MLIALMLPAGINADSPAAARFQRLDISSFDVAKVDTSLLAIANPSRQTKVVVELAAAPVAIHERDAIAAGNRLTDAQRATLRSQIKAGQSGVVSSLKGLGAKVLGQYQDAYDGVKVQVAAGKIAGIANLPGVVAVHKVAVYAPDNQFGVPYIGAPTAWGSYGETGAGVKIGMIDTGIDYTHANFGGSGNPADYAAQDSTTLADGGFPNAKVAGGTDFVGDNYDADPADATYQPIPHPDPDPLDCGLGHGSHTAGTAAGYGVLSNGTTYTGPYNASTVSSHTWTIGPGVAPEATLYSYKVFGCEGSTDVVVDAINQAVADGMDVINLSLGSPFGDANDPDSVAADNASLAGVLVVASAGNEGPSAQMTGSPAASTRALSVAAMDASNVEEGRIDIGAGLGGQFDPALRGTLPVTGTVRNVLLDPATLDLGCGTSPLPGISAGDIAVVSRGSCSFAEKGANAEAAGAAALIVVNNDPSGTFFPGGVDTLSIPVFIFDQSYGPALIAADGETHTITDVFVPSPFKQLPTAFTSGGPRDLDDALKPEVSAPGANVVSTGVGTGNAGITLSGTSMAAPHTTGTAALVIQAHPSWSPEQVKAAIIDTANATDSNPGGIASWDIRLSGSGVVDAARAVSTLAFATTSGGADTLSFGYDPTNGSYSETKSVTIWNTGKSTISYKLAASFDGSEYGALGAHVSVSPSRVSVPAHGHRTVWVRISLSRSKVAALPGVDDLGVTVDPLYGQYMTPQLTIAGVVTATPTFAGKGRYPLRVPFLAAPRALSDVSVGPKSSYHESAGVKSATVRLQNRGVHAGTADVYSWGISDPREGYAINDLRAVGVQAIDAGIGEPLLVFAVNTWGRWGNASKQEYDIAIDTNRDGNPDYYVVGYDLGALTSATGEPNGVLASFIFDASFSTLIDFWVADAPANGSTVELPAAASDFGLAPGASSFDYTADIFNPYDDTEDDASGVGHFDAYAPAISQGDYIALKAGAKASLKVSVNKASFKSGNGALGWMVVTLDDRNGAAQADLVRAGYIH